MLLFILKMKDSIPVINFDKLKEEKEKEKEQKKRESLIRRQMLIGQINPELSKIVANAIIKVNKRNSTKNEIIDKKVEVKKDEKKNNVLKYFSLENRLVNEIFNFT